jgi:hypothetical protein
MSKKISELTAVTSLSGPELLEVVQDGGNKKATVTQLSTYIASQVGTADNIDRVTVATSGAITLNMNSKVARQFIGDLNISGSKTWSITNITNAVHLIFMFGISAGSAQTLPTGGKYFGDPSNLLDISGDVWTPSLDGNYIFRGNYDGTNWWWTIVGPSL